MDAGFYASLALFALAWAGFGYLIYRRYQPKFRLITATVGGLAAGLAVITLSLFYFAGNPFSSGAFDNLPPDDTPQSQQSTK